jgi:DNA-binding NarL/FixJ family response regulator
VDSRRLLIVDDHEGTRHALGGIFRDLGYEVAMAASVAEGILSLRPPPHCVVLDLTLPDGPGDVLLEKIRADGLSTRVIVCTGLVDDGRLEALQALGPQAVMIKPVDVEDLIRACRDDG